MSSRAIILLAVLVAIAVVATVTHLLVGKRLIHSITSGSLPAAWQRATVAYDMEARARMCRDLIKRFLQHGIKRNES